MQTQTVDCSCKPSLSAFRAEMAKVEGDLMVISALLRLDIGRDKDEDGFEPYVWELSRVANILAGYYVYNIVPDVLRPEIDALYNMSRKIDAVVWDFFFQDAMSHCYSIVTPAGKTSPRSMLSFSALIKARENQCA